MFRHPLSRLLQRVRFELTSFPWEVPQKSRNHFGRFDRQFQNWHASELRTHSLEHQDDYDMLFCRDRNPEYRLTQSDLRDCRWLSTNWMNYLFQMRDIEKESHHKFLESSHKNMKKSFYFRFWLVWYGYFHRCRKCPETLLSLILRAETYHTGCPISPYPNLSGVSWGICFCLYYVEGQT
jgi:hypothetical protein